MNYNSEINQRRHQEFFRKELKRLNIDPHEKPPTHCNECNAELESGEGMVGEEVLYCSKHGIKWEDAAGAIRNVI